MIIITYTMLSLSDVINGYTLNWQHGTVTYISCVRVRVRVRVRVSYPANGNNLVVSVLVERLSAC